MDSTRNKVCGETSCVFSTSTSDTKERSASMRKLAIAIVVVLCILFMTIEVVGGIKANSLAILTDEAHLKKWCLFMSFTFGQ
ncbi:hypothetical protein Bca52824_078159 [Brassica carinata]|uniref:Uncharacterized protein n=1 Tax=Brassica carinata TaxID=52824 RepID=A0A8X7PXB8_BRACI|nr:hypothetical protein Bca52824_078159 [Brassica carinata]